MCAEIRELQETVEKLREIVNRNSQNSSQPPPKIAPTNNQPKNQPDPRANEGDNRVIGDIIECWSMKWTKWACTSPSVVRDVERYC
jgi:hypothetical protein